MPEDERVKADSRKMTITGFLNIPLEIRRQIYRCLLVSPYKWVTRLPPSLADKVHQEPIPPISPDGWISYEDTDTNVYETLPFADVSENLFDIEASRPLHTAILAVNKQIHKEACDVLLKENSVLVDTSRWAYDLDVERELDLLLKTRRIFLSVTSLQQLNTYLRPLRARRNIKELHIKFWKICPGFGPDHNVYNSLEIAKFAGSFFKRLSKIRVQEDVSFYYWDSLMRATTKDVLKELIPDAVQKMMGKSVIMAWEACEARQGKWSGKLHMGRVVVDRTLD